MPRDKICLYLWPFDDNYRIYNWFSPHSSQTLKERELFWTGVFFLFLHNPILRIVYLITFYVIFPTRRRGGDFYLHLARLSFPNPSVSGHSVSNLPRSFAVRWTGTWQGWWLMGFRLTLTLCMHPCKSMKRSVSMWGDKVICHPWQRLIFSSCFWHSGLIAPLPPTTANCAVFIAGI